MKRRKERIYPREENSCAGSGPEVVLSAAATSAASKAPGAAAESGADCFAGSAPVAANVGSARRQQNDSPQPMESSLEPAPRLPRAAGAADAVPRKACKFWPTAEGCRKGSGCKFRHDASARDGPDDSVEGGGEGESDRGAKEWCRPGGGCVRFGGGTAGGTARRGVGAVSHGGVVDGAGCASSSMGGAMEEDGGDGDPSSVDEIISGMSKLLIPRQLGFGSTARVG